eukprot:1430292-Heterocapsa_arctica.AAC.1
MVLLAVLCSPPPSPLPRSWRSSIGLSVRAPCPLQTRLHHVNARAVLPRTVFRPPCGSPPRL